MTGENNLLIMSLLGALDVCDVHMYKKVVIKEKILKEEELVLGCVRLVQVVAYTHVKDHCHKRSYSISKTSGSIF